MERLPVVEPPGGAGTMQAGGERPPAQEEDPAVVVLGAALRVVVGAVWAVVGKSSEAGASPKPAQRISGAPLPLALTPPFVESTPSPSPRLRSRLTA